ncbi:MAG: hypothetical protein IT374_12425 [Polyangiaceae bacterium]|nr:hypothetical protein [Polyangiaceae bacterium]
MSAPRLRSESPASAWVPMSRCRSIANPPAHSARASGAIAIAATPHAAHVDQRRGRVRASAKSRPATSSAPDTFAETETPATSAPSTAARSARGSSASRRSARPTRPTAASHIGASRASGVIPKRPTESSGAATSASPASGAPLAVAPSARAAATPTHGVSVASVDVSACAACGLGAPPPPSHDATTPTSPG